MFDILYPQYHGIIHLENFRKYTNKLYTRGTLDILSFYQKRLHYKLQFVSRTRRTCKQLEYVVTTEAGFKEFDHIWDAV